ncbi:MAG: hypothetical protein MJK10_03945 [Pseudomonadales bacterium]|nr:hypothetical protein [Pseudomonadales bacterium]NRA15224.1 hypothetical protein [Oceanospirillaceae bacterium]
MSQDSNERIVADILIAKISCCQSSNSTPSAEKLAEEFQILYNQLKYADNPHKKPSTLTEEHNPPYGTN